MRCAIEKTSPQFPSTQQFPGDPLPMSTSPSRFGWTAHRITVDVIGDDTTIYTCITVRDRRASKWPEGILEGRWLCGRYRILNFTTNVSSGNRKVTTRSMKGNEVPRKKQLDRCRYLP